MQHIMLCISGWSGTGKDELAKRLVSGHGATQTGLADPAKRHLADVYGFTEDQLFGPSQSRNAGDPRVPKNIVSELGMRVDGEEYVLDMAGPLDRIAAITLGKKHGIDDLVAAATGPERSSAAGMASFRAKVTDPRFSLSPREALQIYCEQLNNLHINTWVAKGVADQVRLARGGYRYTKMHGLVADSSGHWNPRSKAVTCFADFRHIHEFRYTRSVAAGSLTPVLIRIKRPTVTKPPYNHRSEVEQVRVRDAAFDFVVNNDGTIGDLYGRVDRIIEEVSVPGWRPKAWDESFVLPTGGPDQGYTP